MSHVTPEHLGKFFSNARLITLPIPLSKNFLLFMKRSLNLEKSKEEEKKNTLLTTDGTIALS